MVMKQKFTREEFIAKWRELKGFAPMYYDGHLVVTDGIDLNYSFGTEADEWYRRLLREGDESLLWKEDLASEVTLRSGDGCLILALPEGVVRVTDVRLTGWRRRARVVDDPESIIAQRQLHPYTRSCSDNPVAVYYPDNSLALYPAEGDERLAELKCVVMRDDEYAFDTAALAPIVAENK